MSEVNRASVSVGYPSPDPRAKDRGAKVIRIASFGDCTIDTLCEFDQNCALCRGDEAS